MSQSFEIVYQPFFSKGKKYRMQVEMTHKSDQVIRFRIHSGDRYILMEKRLLNKSQPWKVMESNIDFAGNGIEKSTYTLYEIQERLDAWLNKDNQRPPGNPKYEH